MAQHPGTTFSVFMKQDSPPFQHDDLHPQQQQQQQQQQKEHENEQESSLLSPLLEPLNIPHDPPEQEQEQENRFSQHIPFDLQEIRDRAHPHPKKGLGILQASAITVNIMIGTGVFSVPYAVSRAGYLFGAVGILVGALSSFVTLTYLTETISRAQAVTRVQPLQDSDVFRPLGEAFLGTHSPHLRPHYHISDQLFSYAYLCRLFAGQYTALICQTLICLYCYGSLWSYAAVFASSFVSLWYQFVLQGECDVYSDPSQGCNHSYQLVCLLYGVLVCFMSLYEIKDQIVVQQILTLYRFFAFALMIATVLVGMASSPAYGSAQGSSAPFIALDKAWDWSGYNILTTCSVAFAVHVNFAEVIQSLGVRDRKTITRVAANGLGCANLFYMVVGLLCALYFGDHTEPLVILNWKDYKGTSWSKDSSIYVPWWASAIRVLITLFPIFDMLSVYSLLALALASNYHFLLKKRLSTRLSPENVKRFTRLLAAVPSIILATFFFNLDQIFSYTGLCSFMLQLVIPTGLWALALKRCYEIWPSQMVRSNPYTSIFSFPLFPVTIVVFAFSALVLSLYNIV